MISAKTCFQKPTPVSWRLETKSGMMNVCITAHASCATKGLGYITLASACACFPCVTLKKGKSNQTKNKLKFSQIIFLPVWCNSSSHSISEMRLLEDYILSSPKCFSRRFLFYLDFTASWITELKSGKESCRGI